MPTLKSETLQVEVSSDATLTISRGGTVIARGPIDMSDVSAAFGVTPDDGDFQLGRARLAPFDPADADHVLFVQHFERAYAAYELRLRGDDLIIGVSISNHSVSTPLNLVKFTLPVVMFSKPATGNINSWNQSYFTHTGTQLLHPSHWNPTSGVFATDGALGIGCSTSSHLRKRSMFHIAWIRNLNPTEVPQTAPLEFIAEINLDPSQIASVEMVIRFANSSDFKMLLANYEKAFHEQLDGLQYAPDARPWAQSVPADEHWITRQNPLGFEPAGAAQLDWDAGVRRYINERIAPLYGAFQGAILWNPQGYNPRGSAYRPDFDIFPQSVAVNLPALRDGFAQHDLKFGLCARPIDMIWPINPTTDDVVQLDPNTPSQLTALLKRFANVRASGFDAFYLDSFGENLDAYVLMRKLRRALGASIPTFAEQSCDLILPYTGFYTETAENGLANLGVITLDIYRWLMPGINVMAMNRGKWPLEKIYARRLSPMVELYEAPRLVEAIKALNARYLTPLGQWK